MARPTLTTHRKFRRLARVLGSSMLARGALELLWDHCYESGDPYLGTAEDLELLVGWTGAAGALVRALSEAGLPEGAGFIEPSDRTVDGVATYQVRNLLRHAPDYVAKRLKREQERRDRSVARPADRSLTAERRHTADTDRRTAPNGGQCPPSPDCQIEIVRTPAPAPAPARTPAPAPAPPAAAGAARPMAFGRLHLHRWQLDEMIGMLGPHAAAFDLDGWLFRLSGQDRVLPVGRDQLWRWVLEQFEGEVKCRGLPVAGPATPEEQRAAEVAKGWALVEKWDAQRGGR